MEGSSSIPRRPRPRKPPLAPVAPRPTGAVERVRSSMAHADVVCGSVSWPELTVGGGGGAEVVEAGVLDGVVVGMPHGSAAERCVMLVVAVSEVPEVFSAMRALTMADALWHALELERLGRLGDACLSLEAMLRVREHGHLLTVVALAPPAGARVSERARAMARRHAVVIVEADRPQRRPALRP